MKKNYSRVIIIGLSAAALLIFVMSASATDWNVPDDFTTIQAAVDAASDGDIIYVHENIYTESVIIDGIDLSLIAVGTVILTPSSCTVHGDVISVYNANVTIQGFTIDATSCLSGIYALGGLGSGPVSLTVLNTNVHSYQKNGITVNGPEAYGHFADNLVQGSGQIGVPYYAQNGIQFGFGATGQAMRNTIEGNWYTGPDWAASGILIFESNEVTVQDNTIIDCGTAIAIETWCWYFPTANNNRVVMNTINGAEWGISVAAYAWEYSICDASANNNKIVNNQITATNGDTGIFVGTAVLGNTSYTPSANNNKMIHNTIAGFLIPKEIGGTATKVHANVE